MLLNHCADCIIPFFFQRAMYGLIQRNLKIIITFNKNGPIFSKGYVPTDTRNTIKESVKVLRILNCFFVKRDLETIKGNVCVRM